MIRLRTQRRFVAWLAMAAIWLTIVAPVISQTLPTAGPMPGMGMMCGEHVEHAGHPASPHPHVPSMEHCGYCSLLSHTPVLSGAIWLPSVLPQNTYIPVLWRGAPAFSRHSPLAAAPRGPPGFVNA
ncbi:Protein of unknown function [Dyella sp. OK004]|uniref:DUF2946 domain-containing protein n=1 Tax=Dyella sp. OK004 TaxID=1855292 RepID=UPI0008E1D249|nr:DUF2946 domain-containing protein [Dyella sp. OK004]SFS16493.1 Protein of unknown function [Dyella sp. OK004]